MKQLAAPIAGVILLCTVLAGTALAEKGRLRISDDPGTIVLEYGHTHRADARQDPLPLVRIYGDGLVWVHYPAHMPGAGDYEFKLDRGELRGLINAVERSGLLGFDRTRTLGKRAATQRVHGDAPAVAGDTDTRVRIRLERYRGRPDFDKSIVWTNVDSDARAYPGLTAVQALARLERQLRAMIQTRPLAPLELPLAQR